MYYNQGHYNALMYVDLSLQWGWTMNVYAGIKALPVQNGIQQHTFDIIVKYNFSIDVTRDLKYIYSITSLVSEPTVFWRALNSILYVNDSTGKAAEPTHLSFST